MHNDDNTLNVLTSLHKEHYVIYSTRYFVHNTPIYAYCLWNGLKKVTLEDFKLYDERAEEFKETINLKYKKCL